MGLWTFTTDPRAQAPYRELIPIGPAVPRLAESRQKIGGLLP